MDDKKVPEVFYVTELDDSPIKTDRLSKGALDSWDDNLVTIVMSYEKNKPVELSFDKEPKDIHYFQWHTPVTITSEENRPRLISLLSRIWTEEKDILIIGGSVVANYSPFSSIYPPQQLLRLCISIGFHYKHLQHTDRVLLAFDADILLEGITNKL